jgi:hypothetical protein
MNIGAEAEELNLTGCKLRDQVTRAMWVKPDPPCAIAVGLLLEEAQCAGLAVEGIEIPVEVIDLAGHIGGDLGQHIVDGAGRGAALRPGMARRHTTGPVLLHLGHAVDRGLELFELDELFGTPVLVLLAQRLLLVRRDASGLDRRPFLVRAIELDRLFVDPFGRLVGQLPHDSTRRVF